MSILKSKIRAGKKKLKHSIFRSRLKNPDFCIVGRDCWGSRIYQELNFEYNTPFVGLFLFSPCYIHLLSDFRQLMNQEIVFTDQSKYPIANDRRKQLYYPIGVLGGEVEIHFLHYESTEEAANKWARRSKRINYDNLFIAYNDKEQFRDEYLEIFEHLPFDHKVFFTAKKELKSPSSVWISECNGKPYVDDLYAKSYLVHRHFDVIDWLNGGTGSLKPWIRTLNRIVENRK